MLQHPVNKMNYSHWSEKIEFLETCRNCYILIGQRKYISWKLKKIKKMKLGENKPGYK